MNELIEAAKAVIERWDMHGCVMEKVLIDGLRAAVERAENPPANYNEWTARHSGQTVSPYELWTAAQLAEREKWVRAAKRMEEEHSYKYLDELLEMIDAPT